MSPGDVVKVPPSDIRFKLWLDLDLNGIQGGDWDIERRVIFAGTEKYRSIVQHFIHGRPWIETDLFRHSYAARFKKGGRVRGAKNLEALAFVYEKRVDPMYESLKREGFLSELNGTPVPLPKVHIARDGEIILGNQGNHRLAMAQMLKLSEIIVRVHTRHAEYHPA